MNNFSRLSLKYKLVSIIMLTSFLTLLLGGFAFFLNDRYSTNNTIIYILTSQAKIIGANSTAALTFNDIQAADETLATLATQKHILNAAIFLPDRSVFAQYALQTELAADQLPYQAEGYNIDKGTISVFEPIILDKKTIGTAYIKANIDELRHNITGYTSIVLAAMLAALGLALILSSWLQKAITGPIFAIKKITDKITSEQDYSLRIRKKYHDELGTVIEGINNMLEQIQQRDQQLEDYASTLEQKVVQRTEELEDLTQKLRHQAYHDALTGLPNRVLFYERLELSINQGERYNKSHAILYLDLDGFKQINDKFGHATGDELLKTVSSRMSASIRQSDTISRLGGDEFAIILNDIDSQDSVSRMAKLILEAICKPVDCMGTQANVSGSIGISMYPEHSKDAANLMKFADAAMYKAKRAGKNNYKFYQSTISGRS